MRQLLKSLCIHSPWNYAVFWKLRHKGEMILSWEDGYFDDSILSENGETMSGGAYCIGDNGKTSSFVETYIGNGNNGGYPITQVVAHMSSLQFKVGEGIVGEVASTGNHLWVSFDNISSGKVNSTSFLQCSEEWLLQLAFGIKTILLVPILPAGVVQLGSFSMVAEDLALVNHIKEIFTLQNVRENAVLFTLNSEIRTQSSQLHRPRENSENKLFGLSCLEEDLLAYFQCEKYNMEPLEQLCGGAMDSIFTENSKEQPFEDKSQRRSEGLHNFPKDYELHEALGPGYQSCRDDYVLESFSLSDNIFSSSRMDSDKDLTDGLASMWFAEGGDAEYRLEALISNLYSGLDNIPDDMSNTVNSSLTPMGQSIGPSQPQDAFEASPMVGDDDSVRSNITSACFFRDRNESVPLAFRGMTGTCASEEQLEKEDCSKKPGTGRRVSTVSKKRPRPGDNQKPRPGDNQKPRPRDRQLIQDRIKELRKLVPNGTKYSIDGLLEQTVKHMMYLRSVTDQAEKLKNWVHQEVDPCEEMRSSEATDCKLDGTMRSAGATDCNLDGTTLAIELGTELPVCPIVVEDLPYPGHMLIEMMCSDHGLFLEIANMIRSSHLNILKGVMEKRSNTTWAHFVVEASKGFHRMDIFWPLMYLWQSKRNPVINRV